MNWPTRLTVARLFLVPAFAIALLSESTSGPAISSLVLVVAGLTDVLDGFLARRRGEESIAGRLLDPLADKLIVLAGVTMLALSKRMEWWLVFVLLAKEALQVGGAAVFWATHRRTLTPSALGKMASALLYLGMFAAIWEFGAAKIFVAAGITVSIGAGFDYSRRVLKPNVEVSE